MLIIFQKLLSLQTVSALDAKCHVPDDAFRFLHAQRSLKAVPGLDLLQDCSNMKAWISKYPNLQLFTEALPEALYRKWFKRSNGGTGADTEPYTYCNLLRSVGLFPDFCGAQYGLESCKLEIATVFGHASVETGLVMGTTSEQEFQFQMDHTLYWIHEGANRNEDLCVRDQSCKKNDNLRGRGPLQLSFYYNYKGCSQALFSDNSLHSDPQKVSNSYLAIACSIWFYMTAQPPKPSMHAIMVGVYQPNGYDLQKGRQQGFRLTPMIINGECGSGSKKGRGTATWKRAYFFRQWAIRLGIGHLKAVTDDDLVFCGTNTTPQSFNNAASNGSVPMFWQPSSSGVTKNGVWQPPCGCKPVNFTTDFPMALGISEQYCKCLKKAITLESQNRETCYLQNCNRQVTDHNGKHKILMKSCDKPDINSPTGDIEEILTTGPGSKVEFRTATNLLIGNDEKLAALFKPGAGVNFVPDESELEVLVNGHEYKRKINGTEEEDDDNTIAILLGTLLPLLALLCCLLLLCLLCWKRQPKSKVQVDLAVPVGLETMQNIKDGELAAQDLIGSDILKNSQDRKSAKSGSKSKKKSSSSKRSDSSKRSKSSKSTGSKRSTDTYSTPKRAKKRLRRH